MFAEPALIPIQGVLHGRVLTRVETFTPQRSKLTSQTGCVEIGQAVNRAHVVVANLSYEPLTIPKSTVIGVAEPVSGNLVISGEQTDVKLPTVPCRKKINEELYKLLRSKLDHLPLHERRLIETLLVKYGHVFHDQDTKYFEATDVVEHKITVEKNTLIRRPK